MAGDPYDMSQTIEQIINAGLKESDPNHISGHTVTTALEELLPGLMTYVQCPDKNCPKSPEPIMSLVQHLNDTHRWTREQIADWLESLDVDLTFPTPTDKEKEDG